MVKISRLVGIIAKLGHLVPRNTLLRIYQSLILPYISYGLAAWGLASKSYLTKILVLQKRALRAQLYGLGYPRQPSPRATLAEVTFSLFLSKIQPAVYIRIANSSRGARQLGWASCLTSAGRVTLASGTTFLHINALARLTGTSLGVANVT